MDNDRAEIYNLLDQQCLTISLQPENILDSMLFYEERVLK